MRRHFELVNHVSGRLPRRTKWREVWSKGINKMNMKRVKHF